MSNLRERLLQAVDAELDDLPRGRSSDEGDQRREFLEAVRQDLDQGLMTMAVMGMADEYVRRAGLARSKPVAKSRKAATKLHLARVAR